MITTDNKMNKNSKGGFKKGLVVWSNEQKPI